MPQWWQGRQTRDIGQYGLENNLLKTVTFYTSSIIILHIGQVHIIALIGLSHSIHFHVLDYFIINVLFFCFLLFIIFVSHSNPKYVIYSLIILYWFIYLKIVLSFVDVSPVLLIPSFTWEQRWFGGWHIIFGIFSLEFRFQTVYCYKSHINKSWLFETGLVKYKPALDLPW